MLRYKKVAKLTLKQEIILKLDRIEAELQTLRIPIVVNGKHLYNLKDKIEIMEERLKIKADA